ncbi:MAG: hypothetical protein ACI9IT_001592 [Glaciecola sp.]|jgi:hypothetical protein
MLATLDSEFSIYLRGDGVILKLELLAIAMVILKSSYY